MDNRAEKSQAMQKHGGIDKPPMEPIKVAEGFQFIDFSDIRSRRKFVSGLVLNIGLGLLVFLFITQLGGLHVVTLIFILLLSISIGIFIHRTQLVARIEPGELTLSHHPLRLGDTTTLKFCRRFRDSYQVQQLGHVCAYLICMEIAHYRVGTDRRVVQETIWEQELANQDILPGSNCVEFSTTFQIPVDGIPSFEAPSNQVRWGIWIWIDCPEMVKDDSTFTFTVKPEVVA